MKHDPHGLPLFGAVYFRKTNPPQQDWERDYAIAREDGHTLFRHWVPWAAIEIAPGVYDWEDYDRQLDLAARHGIRTILAEMSVVYPEWLYTRNQHARLESRDGTRRHSEMNVSCVTGGQYSLCLDNPEIAEACAGFLTALGQRYRGHPGLYGYDVWNECSYYGPGLLCHCPATERRFRDWLKTRYPDLRALGQAWHRYGITGWEDVRLPRQANPYPDFFDATAFHGDNAYRWFNWKVELLRRADPNHLVVAHGNGKSHCDIVTACGDDFRAAQAVDLFGYTYWQENRCDPFLAADTVRCASRGKTFWRAEAVGDSYWQGRGHIERAAPEKDRMHDPLNIRLDCLISLACGARAFMTPRWRPLLDGPLFGAFGWYGMDGSRTERSAMVSGLARWAADPAVAPLWNAAPVRGEMALLLAEESQAWCYAMYGNTDFYSHCVQGAFEALLHANIQCDVVKLDQIDNYKLVYAPFAVALSDQSSERLAQWIKAGGWLVSEASLGYFNERGHAFPKWPNRALADLTGCAEHGVSFAPDMHQQQTIRMADGNVPATLFRQTYLPTQGVAAGWFGDGNVAAVVNKIGTGGLVNVGAMPGHAYKHAPTAAARAWYASLVGLAGLKQRIIVDTPGIVARLWRSESGDSAFLWVVNTGERKQQVAVTVAPSAQTFRGATVLRGDSQCLVGSATLHCTVDGRDAVVVRLLP